MSLTWGGDVNARIIHSARKLNSGTSVMPESTDPAEWLAHWQIGDHKAVSEGIVGDFASEQEIRGPSGAGR
jgi:hypothetical protein